MATIVYLDVDDEITSAATRIRAAEENRVALVLPYGSRLATSRINFRLLAREAMLRGRRLGIVAPDASTRALAASAGLPVFLTVGEYESSLDLPEDAAAPRAPSPSTVDDPVAPGAALAASTTVATAGAAPVTTTPAGSPLERTLRLEAPPRERSPAAAGRVDAESPRVPTASGAGARSAAASTVALPVARPARRFHASPGMLVGLAILALAVVVAGVAGFVFLPTARVAISPLVATVGPLAFDIRADPAAADVDVAEGVIPAVRIEIPVRAAGEFPATGKRVEQAKAEGTVTFDSVNTIGSVAIPAGTRVSTLGAVVFATVRRVEVPRAQVNGNTIQHGRVSVGVRAVKDGPESNVGAGEITQVPDFLSTLQVSVNNGRATAGGKLDEFPRVVQDDVDAALAQLTTDLETQFRASLTAPPGLPAGSTAFPETAELGEAVPAVDPTTIVGQEVETFALEVSATGDVLAVDASPLEEIVRERLTGSITEGRQLVDGSIEVAVGDAVVRDGTIRFPVTGVAQEIQPLDAGAIRAAILGKPREEAMAALARFGTVELTLWPDWVSSIPSLEQRVEVVIGETDVPRPTAPALPTPAPTQVPTEAPAGSPSDAASGEPVPSP